ncbi:hypothetical protein [Erythrobacter sp. EC-HK427]|uniref:hypothetical protein n=1 Tax=Erythrobacter sp. EC-HK427 TaxID=2038396 RepID=UPI0012549348|nr:hypothetical protein [Erythrobacter sp. EC-HK427]VVT01673.1 conserved hypothetical protein [Erythrobacter sp. EC-HK427]
MPSSFEALFPAFADETGPAAPSPSGFAAAPWQQLAGETPAGFAPLDRFTAAGADPAQHATAERALDAALNHARAEGEAAGRAAALGEMAAQQAERETLALAALRLQDEARQAFSARLNEAVAALCETAFGPLAKDAKRLTKRCDTVAAMIDDGYRDARFRLHPDDLALLEGSTLDPAQCRADAGLERGTIICETADGELHDGPEEWRARLREALGLC